MAETLDILVVEDEAPAAMEMQQALVEMGHMVSYTTSGEGALEQAARRKPDLVVMDIALKGAMDGVAAAAKLVELYSTLVVFFTARTEPDTIQRAIQLNPLGFLIKPFQEQQLRIALQMAGQRRKTMLARESKEDLLAGIVDSLLDGVLVVSADTKIQFVSARAERMIGRKREDLLDKDFSMVFPEAGGENAQLLVTIDSTFNPSKTAIGSGGRGLLQAADGTLQAVVAMVNPAVNRAGVITGASIMFRPAPKRTDAPSPERSQEKQPTAAVAATAPADDESAQPYSRDSLEVVLSNGNPMRETVLRAISTRLKSSTQSFVTVLILNQFDAFRSRYGATSEKLVNVFAANLMKLLPDEDRMYQWSSRAIVVLSDRYSSLDDMRLEMTALCARRIDYFLHASERSALLTLSASWTLLSLIDIGALEAVVEQIEAFEKLHTRSRRTLNPLQ